MTHSRRDFLRTALLLSGGSTVFGVGKSAAASVFSAAKEKGILALVRGQDPEVMVAKILHLLGGAGRFISPGDKVVIRGNERLQPGQSVSVMDG